LIPQKEQQEMLIIDEDGNNYETHDQMLIVMKKDSQPNQTNELTKIIMEVENSVNFPEKESQ